jgi:type III secretion protein J
MFKRLWKPLLRGLLFAAAIALAGCRVELYSGLHEQEANEMLAVLHAEGIDAQKEQIENANWQIQVDEGRLSAALAALRAHGLPQDRYVTMGDMFEKKGLVSTPSEERMRYIFAVSQALSQTLRDIDGVVSARVHVVIPANDPLSEKLRPSSAAVFIKHRPDTDLRLLVPAVKDMVAHSIEGLNHDQVSLTLIESRIAPTAAAATLPDSSRSNGVIGSLPTSTAVILIVMLLAGALALVVLPGLLRKRGHDWAWMRRQVFRR